MTNGLAICSGPWYEKNWKTAGKDIWERCIGSIYQGGYGVWRSLYCILIPENIHHNQVDRIQQLIDAYTAYVLSHWQMSNLTATETNTEPPMWYNPLRRWTSHLVASWVHWIPSTLQKPVIYIDWNRQLFWVRVTFIAFRTSTSITIQRFTEFWFTNMGSLKTTDKTRGNILKKKWSSHEHMVMGSIGPVTFCVTRKLPAWWGDGMCRWDTSLDNGAPSFMIWHIPKINIHYIVLGPQYINTWTQEPRGAGKSVSNANQSLEFCFL